MLEADTCDSIFSLNISPIIVLSSEFKIINVNEAAIYLYQWNLTEVIGENFEKICQANQLDYPLSKFLLKKLKISKRENSVTTITIGKQKTIIDWTIHEDKKNNALLYLLIGKDITELKKAQDKIYELDSIIAQLPGNVYWYSKDFHYLGCNENSAKTLGITREEAIGKKFKDLMNKVKNISKKTIDSFIVDGQYVIDTGKPKFNVEEPPFMGPEGKYSYWLANKVPLCDREGNLYGVIGISTDITAFKELEHDLLLAKEKAKYTSIAAGSIAHDLRTPLASIRFAMNAIEKVLPQLLETYQLAYLQGIEVQPIRANKLESLSSAITRCKAEIDFSNHYIDLILGNLKFDRIDTSNYETHSITQVIEYVLQSYPYQNGEMSLVHWQHDTEFNFWGNDFYLKNVLNNLLKNSFFYIKKFSRGEIFICTHEKEEFYSVTVKDTAEGASPEILEHIFDGYFSKREGGTGLGLAFCKAIMQSFNGDIRVESQEGVFIEFTLTFPKHL